MSKHHNEPRLRVIPLGGLGEIGMNMTLIEYGDDIICIDIGSQFPREDMPGVDLVIPDTSYLEQHYDKLRGYVITHGHEDHIGASPYILQNLPAPVYGTRLTLALVEHKLKEHRINNIPLNVTAPGDTVRIGCFEVEFIHVNHSITGAVALAIHTPAGTIVHSGDFKVDYTPIDDRTTDLARLGQLGREGVLCLLCESTNIERQGYTMSERTVGETFNTYFQKAEGRIIVAMFASNIHRIQQVVDAATRYHRRVCLVGRSMINVSKVAMQLGELTIPQGSLLSVDDIDNYDDDELAIITTGSQGEPMSGLARMAFAEHRKLEIRPTDTVIISATPIPGNEKSVSRVINQLVRTGAEVVYEALAEVHVSGHACQEEIKLMHALVKPLNFIPIHGEYRHLYQHAELARQLGMDEKNVLIANVGDIIEFGPDGMAVAGEAPSGEVLIDGLGIGDVGNVVLRDRKHLSQDGLVIIVLAIDHQSGQVLSGPDIISRGFVYVREADDLVEGARAAIRQVLSEYDYVEEGDYGALKAGLRDAVQKYIYQSLKRSPMILPIIMDI